MTAHATPLVVALCLVAALAAVVLVGRLKRRKHPTLRSKIISLMVGLVCVELATSPALLLALVGGEALGVRNSGIETWIVAATYAALTLYVIARLFPWREVNSLVADPDANLRDIVARLRDEEE